MRRLFLKLFRRRRLHEDLEAELAFHREMSAAQGNPIGLGNTTVLREHSLDLWRFNFCENLWRDLAYAARGLRRSPALVATALLSLALGIGANTAIFSLGVEFLFSEPSVTGASSLVSLRLAGSSHTKPRVIEAVRESGAFQDVAGENEESFVNWSDGSETRRVFGVFITKNYFTALGVPIAHGRGIIPSDADEVVVLRHDFWRKYFNSDPSIVGRAIQLEGKPYTVVGVLPENHRTMLGFGFSPDLYLPRYLPDTVLAMTARLKPGMTLPEARAAAQTVGARIDAAFPERYKFAKGIKVVPIAGFARVQQESQMLTIGLFFVVLLAVSGLVLLIACVNVASLLLARAAARRREIAVRLALGAGRARLLQQLLVESLLLSVLGAAAGFLLAQFIATFLARIDLPLPIPIRLRITPDWRVASYAAFLTLIATLACGLLPAWQSVRESISTHLHREPKLRLRRTLVVAQIAISLIVLATGFLFLRNLLTSATLSPGFDLRHTLRAEVHLPRAAYADARRIPLFIEQSLAAFQAIPGIESAAAARIVPFTDSTRFGADIIMQDTGETVRVSFHWNAVTPGFFRTMDIPVLQGRDFTPADRGLAKIAVVNQTFVDRYLGKRPPTGVVFLWGPDNKTPYQIVGVAGVTKNFTLGEEDRPQLYEPLAQIKNERTRIQFVLRSGPPPATQLHAIRQALRQIEPAAGTEVQTLYSAIGLAFLPSQVGAVLLGSIGALGLMLAAIGLYGVLVYSVARRTREIGVRVAIGAQPGDISRLILADSLKLLLTGTAIGLFIAFFITKPLAMFLVPGIKPTDPLALAAVVAVLLLTGLAASLGPIRRARNVDPITALRCD